MPDANAPPNAEMLLTVVYDSGMDERLTETIDALAVRGWTKVFHGHGRGGSGCKLDTPIFPGDVNLLYILLAESDVERVTAAIRALQRSYRRNPGVTMWTTRVHSIP